MGLLGAAIKGGQHVAHQSVKPARPQPIGRSLGRVAQIAHSVMPRPTPQRPARAPSVFHQRIGAVGTPQLQRAHDQAQHRAVKAAQKIPAVAVNNRNIKRQVARETPAYQRQFIRDWMLTRSSLPAGKQPKMDVPKLTTLLTGRPIGMVANGNHPYGAFTDAQHNTIHVSRDLISQAFQGGKGATFAKEAPIHEFAHLFQPARMPRAKAEGGAEAFKILASRRLGMKPVVAPDYAKWARQALGKGSQYVLRGQFKP